MDVMLLEHSFGKEIETSLQQLFTYFCNNFYIPLILNEISLAYPPDSINCDLTSLFSSQ